MTVAPFWDWALRQYAREPTQALLLTLQSQADLVILEALYAAWLSAEGYRLKDQDIAAMRDTTGTWIEEVVVPLRALREQWKGDAGKVDARRHLLQLEVEAERHLAELMWANSESARSEAISAAPSPMRATQHQMNSNLLALPVFQNGKYASEREQLVALLLEST